jgi:hypothetical protein
MMIVYITVELGWAAVTATKEKVPTTRVRDRGDQ